MEHEKYAALLELLQKIIPLALKRLKPRSPGRADRLDVEIVHGQYACVLTLLEPKRKTGFGLFFDLFEKQISLIRWQVPRRVRDINPVNLGEAIMRSGDLNGLRKVLLVLQNGETISSFPYHPP